MSTRLRLRPGLTVRALPDGDAVVARGTGSDAVIINMSAHAIIELLATEGTEEDVLAVFCSTFPGEDASVIRNDVHALIVRLVSDGILEPCGSAPSTA